MTIRRISPEDTSNHYHYNASCGYCSCTLDEDWLQFGTKRGLGMPSIGSADEDMMPFQYNYLVGLFTAPDIAKYLAQSSHNDNDRPLPIHLQRLISEAREEVNFQQQQQQHSPKLVLLPALQRLERVKSYVWPPSGGDIASLMVALTELMSDEDELENILT